MNLISKKRFLPVAFWALAAFEAFGTLLILLRIPPDPKHAVFAGFSLQRLVMFVGSLVLTFAFLALTWASVKDYPFYRKGIQALNNRWLGWLGLFGLFAAAVSAWLLLLTPPKLTGAAIERLQPYLLLIILVVLQGMLAAWYLNPSRFRAALSALRQDLASPSFQSSAGWGLLLLSFLIGLFTIYFTYYNLYDEGDTLSVGWFISQGKVLYRDIFSHHFPVPYLWVGLVMRIFGPSILAARLSVVVLRTIVFAGAIKFSRWPLSGGLAVFAWSLISPLFLGNMLMYDSFGALLLAPSVLVTLAYLAGRATPARSGLAFIGGLLALAWFADPVTVAPGCLLLAALFLSGLNQGETMRERVQAGAVRLGTALLSLSVFGLVFLIGFGVTGALGEFYRQAIWFNQTIYAKYAQMPGALDLLKGAWTGLGVFNLNWQKYPGIYYQWVSYEELDQWIFTGLFFRLAVIGLAVSFLLRRRLLQGISVYLIASMLLWRAEAAWHAQAFMLFAVACAALLVCDLPAKEFALISQRRSFSILPALSLLIVLPLGWMFLWLNVRMGAFLVEHRSELRYEATFSGFEGNGGFYRSVTCHQPDVSILIYPGHMLDYMAAQILPATRYPFMFPWVAETGQAEVVNQLQAVKDKPVMVFIEKKQIVWEHPVKSYLQDLIAMLDREYIQTEENVYISPGLKTRCDQQSQAK